MARKNDSKSSDTDDASAQQVQAAVDEATEKGYVGAVADPHPNEAYSLQSGPDSPGAADTPTPAPPSAEQKES